MKKILNFLKLNNGAFKYIRTISKPYHGYIALITFLQAGSGVIGTLVALSLRDVINTAVAADVTGFGRSIGKMALLLAVSIILGAVLSFLYEHVNTNLENAFKIRLFKSILEENYAEISKEHSGEWMNKLVSDTTTVAGETTGIIPSLAGTIARLISALVIILSFEPRFIYVLVIGGSLLIGVSLKLRKKMKQLYKNVRESDGNLRSRLQDYLGSLVVVRSYAAENTAVEDISKYLADHRRQRLTRTVFSNVVYMGFDVVMDGGYLFAAGFCGMALLSGTMSYGTFAAMLDLVWQVQGPLAGISGFVPRCVALVGSAERLMEHDSEYAGEENAEPAPIGDTVAFYESEFEGVGLDNISFTYPEDETPVLKNYSLFIEKNSVTALTGASGCGKSTSIKLLMGLYSPQEGKRYIKISSGMLSDSDADNYRRLFAYVPQGNFLMSGTVRDVVTFADKSAESDEERVNAALEIACASGFVSELDKGLDTVLGEKGEGLSEGQMQRLAIARAVFSGSPVLLLDESTSALDSATEKQLLENLKKLENRTVIIITHRPAALEICDRQIEFIPE